MIDNGIMRMNRPKWLPPLKNWESRLKWWKSRRLFLCHSKRITDPEEKRSHHANFYKNVFGKLVVKSKAREKYLLQGILTDVDETVAGIKDSITSLNNWALIPKKPLAIKFWNPSLSFERMVYARLEQGWACPPACSTGYPFRDRR